jgi:5-formyltetrahydrofolate cyclo-ligase
MPPFDASQVNQLAEAAKQELRKRMRALRTAHPAAALKVRNSALVTRARGLAAFAQARAVALFFPMEDRKEVDLRELDAEARRQGKRVYYPFLEPRGDALVSGLRLSQSLTDLAERGRRFHEPPPDAPRATRGDVDLLFVPALAVAPSGHRLGYGAGFYDSLLPDVCPPGQAVACDLVLTDARSITAEKPR